MLQVLKIERITPNPMAEGADAEEGWAHRTTVRTFKLSGATYEDITAQADALLAAYLETHPGTVGTWTLSSWVRPYGG